MILDIEFQKLLASISAQPNVALGQGQAIWQNPDDHSTGNRGLSNADLSSLHPPPTSSDEDGGNMLYDSRFSDLASGVDDTVSAEDYSVQNTETEMGNHTPFIATSGLSPPPQSYYMNNPIDSENLDAPFQVSNHPAIPNTFGSAPSVPPLPVFSPPSPTTSFLDMRPPIQQREMYQQAHHASMGWHTEASVPQASTDFQGQRYHDAREVFSGSKQACPTSLWASNTPVHAEPPHQHAFSCQDDTRSAIEEYPRSFASWTQTKTGYTDEFHAYHGEALTPQYYDSRPTIATIPPPLSSQAGTTYGANFGPYHTKSPLPQYPNAHAPRQAHGHAIDHDAQENADCSAFHQGRLEQPHKLVFDQPPEADDFSSSKDFLVELYETLGKILGRNPHAEADKPIQPSQSNHTEVGRRDTFVSTRASQHGAGAPTTRPKPLASHRGAQPSSKTSPRHHPYQQIHQRGGNDPTSGTSQHASKQSKSTSSSATQDAGRPHNDKKRNEKRGSQESEAPRTQMLVRPEDHKAMVPKTIEIDDMWTRYEFGPAEKTDSLKVRQYHGPVAKVTRGEKRSRASSPRPLLLAAAPRSSI